MPCQVVEYDDLITYPKVADGGVTLRAGDLVSIRSRGENRLARVTKVGSVRIETEYTTVSASIHAARFGRKPTITRKPVSLDDPWLRFVRREQRVIR